MAEITKIVASRSTRVNTGQYEGTEYFLSLEATIDPELDDAEEERKLLEAKLNQAMLATLVSAHKATGKAVTVAAVAKRHGITIPKED